VDEKTLTVRKLRRILNDLPPHLPVVLEGTEWGLEAGEPRSVLYIELR
jgi:hypothetical protein